MLQRIFISIYFLFKGYEAIMDYFSLVSIFF